MFNIVDWDEFFVYLEMLQKMVLEESKKHGGELSPEEEREDMAILRMGLASFLFRQIEIPLEKLIWKKAYKPDFVRDGLQEAFLQIWRKIHKLQSREPHSAKAFGKTIGVRAFVKFRDRLRKRSGRETDWEGEWPEPIAPSEDSLEHEREKEEILKEIHLILSDQIRVLNLKERRVVLLRLQALPFVEIGKRLEVFRNLNSEESQKWICSLEGDKLPEELICMGQKKEIERLDSHWVIWIVQKKHRLHLFTLELQKNQESICYKSITENYAKILYFRAIQKLKNYFKKVS